MPNSRIRVFIADDHAILREGINALLVTNDDVEVVGEAADGIESVEKASELKPDVVLMDIGMPALDGLEATRRIRKESPHTRVIMLTQHEQPEYVATSIKAGASGYLPKRALASDLMAAIHAVCRGDSYLYPSAARTLIEEYVREPGTNGSDRYERLTKREREVLKLVAEGRTNREIADLLVISTKTVLGHRANLMDKLDIHNRTELVKYAIRKGLIELDS